MVVSELIGSLVVEGDTLRGGCLDIDSVHIIVTASPLRQESVEDVLRHEAVETNYLGTRVFLFAPQMVEQDGHSPCRYRRTFVEAVVRSRPRLQYLQPLLLTPTLHGGLHPLHRHFVHRLQELVLGVSLVHQTVHRSLHNASLLLTLRTEPGRIIAQDFLVDASNDFSCTITTFDGTLVDVLVQRVLRATEQRAVDDVHIGIVARLAQAITTELRPEVVCQAVHGIEVGKGTLVAFGHRGQLLVEEKESQRFAILADEHVGTLHQFCSRDGLQVSDGGERFVGQLLVLRCRLLQLLIGLLDAFLLEILQLELAHQLLYNGSGE